MRRGSVYTYAEEGRRNSANMAQLEIPNNRSEFSVDHIKYNREGGCFVSYKKLGISILTIIICIIAAGFIGANISSSPDKKVHDPLALINDEMETEPSSDKHTIPSDVYPSSYNIYLEPIFVMKSISKIQVRIVIEFRQNNTKSLEKLVLNAQNIKPIRYRLRSLNREMNETHSASKKRSVSEENNNETTISSEQVEVTTNITPTDNSIKGNLGEENETPDTITDPSSTDKSISQLENLKDGSSGNKSELHDVNLDNRSPSVESNYSTEEIQDEKDLEREGVKGQLRRLDENLPVDLSHVTPYDTGISNYEIDEVNEIHVIHPKVPMELGNYILELNYEIPVNSCAILVTNFTASGEPRWAMATKLKPTNARQLFPIFDDIKFEARFSLYVTRPIEMTVLSNMPIKMTEEPTNGQAIDVFDETPLLLPYNFAFVETDLQPIVKTNYSEPSVTITFWGDSKRKSQVFYLLNKIDTILDTFGKLFSITYPLKKLDVIGLPMAVDGIGSLGLITIKENLFYVGEQSLSMIKIKAVKNMIHHVGEQWLGGLINTQNWTDAWLLEGSLIYFSYKLLKEIDLSLDASGSFESDVLWKTMDRDSYSVSRSLQTKIQASHLDTFETEEQYSKGACIIRMLHGVLTESAFRNGYQKFVSRWIHGNGNLESFWEAMMLVSKNVSENLPLNGAMTPWIVQNGYPFISVRRNYKTGSASISQKLFTYDNSSKSQEKLWYIPLTYVDSNGDWSFPVKTWMNPEPEITIENVGTDKKSWIVFNINRTGYYRVNYEEDNWKLLAEALKKNHQQFPPETRASLIDDVFSLAQGGFTSYEMAFNILDYIKTKEKHYAPWAAVTAHLLKLKFALYDTFIYENFQIFCRDILTTIYNELESNNQEGSQLALLLKDVACNFEHPKCLEWARKEFAMEKTSGVNSLPTHISEVFYCTIARDGGEEDWHFFQKKIATATDKEEKNQLLASLACFRIPWILQKVLNMIVQGDSFNEEESRIILQSFSKNPESAFAIQRFLERNWSDVIAKFGKSHSVLKAFIVALSKSLVSEQDLVEFQEFRENNYDSLKIVGYNVVFAEVESDAWVQWQNTSLPLLKTLINEHTKSI